jgi:hypothetical protein
VSAAAAATVEVVMDVGAAAAVDLAPMVVLVEMELMLPVLDAPLAAAVVEL